MSQGDRKSEKPLRLLVVDDRVELLHALKALLDTCPDLEVVGQSSCGEDAVSLSQALHPDVVLMDCEMTPVSGLRATRRIKQAQYRPRVLLLSMDAGFKQRALEAGADKFLMKGRPTWELLDAIRGAPRIARGQSGGGSMS